MGNCLPFQPLEEERVRYAFHNLTFHELSRELQYGTKVCFICSGIIPHAYVSVTKCNKCERMIGHARCVSKWRLTYHRCPICKQ